MLEGPEVAKHNSRESCWVIIKGKVYDVTDFLDEHPGGSSIILRYGGKDATAEYDPIHPPGTIEENLPADKYLGPVDPATTPTPENSQVVRDLAGTEKIPLSLCLSLDDLEAGASKTLSRRAWTFYHSAADSLSSLESNRQDWNKISFRPRILRNVARVNMSRTIMGQKLSLPFFVAPAARARLAHPDGELCIARGAARLDIGYCTSNVASVSHEDLAHCLTTDPERKSPTSGALFFQLYVPRDKPKARDVIAKARRLGYKALVVTVDSAVIGKREEDERYQAELSYGAGDAEIPRTSADDHATVESNLPILRGAHSSTLDWDDLVWIRECWGDSGPIVLKGIQTAEDAKLAYGAGVDGIYLSNHGGRQADHAPSSIRTLLEIRRFCPEVLDKMEIYLDGGVRRGADIIKALALGATAVGLGRPFLYACAYGTEGVLKAIQSKHTFLRSFSFFLHFFPAPPAASERYSVELIGQKMTVLSEEIETTMRLIGVTNLSQLTPDLVNCTILERELPPTLSAFGTPPLRSKL
jgi:L-lactate dehydrogenase (cytochrome)